MNDKFCPNCGSKLELDDNNFCESCGYNLNQYNSNNNFINYKIQYTNYMAISGFILSIVSFLLCFSSLSWLSLILSIIGYNNAKKHNNESENFALAGIILSVVGLVWILFIVWAFRYT